MQNDSLSPQNRSVVYGLIFCLFGKNISAIWDVQVGFSVSDLRSAIFRFGYTLSDIGWGAGLGAYSLGLCG